MSQIRRGSEASIYVGGMNSAITQEVLTDIFEKHGNLVRCDIKITHNAYAFIEYEDVRDAEDAILHERGREYYGRRISVEWARGNPRSRNPLDRIIPRASRSKSRSPRASLNSPSSSRSRSRSRSISRSRRKSRSHRKPGTKSKKQSSRSKSRRKSKHHHDQRRR